MSPIEICASAAGLQAAQGEAKLKGRDCEQLSGESEGAATNRASLVDLPPVNELIDALVRNAEDPASIPNG
jgi:hypothetical protein